MNIALIEVEMEAPVWREHVTAGAQAGLEKHQAALEIVIIAGVTQLHRGVPAPTDARTNDPYRALIRQVRASAGFPALMGRFW